MPWNGSGSISLTQDFIADKLAGSPASIVTAAKVDNVLEDIVDCIEACINRNGENTVAANINFGGFKITNLGAATSVNDTPRARQIAENVLQYGGSTTGSSGTYAASMTFLSAVATGTRLLLKANHSNSGASTLNINAAGAVAIKKADGSTALDAANIVSGNFFEVVYDGSVFRLVNAEGAFQPIDPTLTALAGTTIAADKLVYGSGSDAFSTTDFTAFARTILDDANAGAVRTTLGLAIGTDVQAYDAELAALAGLTSAADRLPYFTGSGTAALATFTAAGRALVDDAAASDQRTTLGLGTAAVLDAGTSVNNLVQMAAGPKLPAVDGSALTKITHKFISTTSVSGAAQLDITAGIDSTCDMYELHITDLRPATDGANLFLRTSTDGGSSFAATSYLSGNFVATSGAGSALDSSTAGVLLNYTTNGVDNSTSYGWNGVLRIWNPSGSSTRKNVEVDGAYLSNGNGLQRVIGAGTWDGGNTAINALRLVASSGNITGTVKLVGVKYA